jgi:spore germination protein KC
MRTRKRLAYISILLILPILLGGCWSGVEVQRRAILASAGIDVADDPAMMSLTMQVINPVMTSGSEDAILIVTAVADSLFMATRKARHMLSRQPYWGQLQIFVISEEIARRSIKPVLDPLSRDYETNRQAWVLIAKGVTAKTILHAGWGFTGIPATEILGLVQMAYADGLINIANVNDMVMSLERGGQSTTTGYLELSFDTKHPPQQIDPEAKVVLAGSAGRSRGGKAESVAPDGEGAVSRWCRTLLYHIGPPPGQGRRYAGSGGQGDCRNQWLRRRTDHGRRPILAWV